MSAHGHELVEFKPHSSGAVPREMFWDVDTVLLHLLPGLFGL